MADFFDEFFVHGWPYFYRFCLSMLGVFKDKLLEEDEFAGILAHIKFKTPEKSHPDIMEDFTGAGSVSPTPHKNQLFIFNE